MSKQTNKEPLEDKRVPADVPRKVEHHDDVSTPAKTIAQKRATKA